ncbi:MAG: hypothetical protein H5T63_04935 [Chloroflexi bacterium]|nr:hypothetical protein [Chloroflexota bacterium]
MTNRLEAILDEWLNEIDSEESLEARVAQQPAVARELEPLLRLAFQLKSLQQEQVPPPAALQRGRQKLLSEVARLKASEAEKGQVRQFPLWLNLQSLLRRGVVTIVLVALLLSAVLGAGTVAASAKSLPGDPLYAIKRAAEEFQLLITFDRQAKAQLVQKLDERRREEAKAIASSQRIAELSFRGHVDHIEAVYWTIGGVVIRTTTETVLEGDISIGTFVRVHVRSLSDGTLLAVRISAEPEQVPTEAVAPPKPTPSPTCTAVPTETPTPTEPPPMQAPVQPPPPLPTPTPSQTVTPKPTVTRTATATAIPPTVAPPREVKIRFKGRIEAIAAAVWTIGGQAVKVNAHTRIDESSARAAVGAMAAVVATRQEDGALLAIEITIEQAAPPAEQPFEFQGLIESWSPTQWVVGGHTLIITADTRIEGSPQKGLLAEVKALRQADGTLVARQIVIQLPQEEVQFEGMIQSINPTEWVVEGVTVRIDAQTVIEGTPVVGQSVEVQGLLLPDGAVLGRRIIVLNPASLTPTPA